MSRVSTPFGARFDRPLCAEQMLLEFIEYVANDKDNSDTAVLKVAVHQRVRAGVPAKRRRLARRGSPVGGQCHYGSHKAIGHGLLRIAGQGLALALLARAACSNAKQMTL